MFRLFKQNAFTRVGSEEKTSILRTGIVIKTPTSRLLVLRISLKLFVVELVTSIGTK